MASQLPSVSSLPTADTSTITSVLDVLFEPAPEIHDLAVPELRQQSFVSYPALITHVGDLMLQLCDYSSVSDTTKQGKQKQALHGILGSHPRLGAPKTNISAHSAAEQANLQQQQQATTDGEDLAEKLRLLNVEYEGRFPGLRYVVFVNGRGRPEIMADMRRRIDRGDLAAEEQEGVRAMIDIALDRAAKLC